MWGRSGPEVTAALPVSNSRADMNMQMGQKAATGCSHVGFRNQSAVFRLWELTIIFGSSALMCFSISRWRWAGCVCSCSQTSQMIRSKNGISLGSLTVTYVPKLKSSQVYLTTIFLLRKASVLSNIKHSWSYLNGCLFLLFFFFNTL